MNRRVAIGALRIGSEPRVETWNIGMARKAEVRHLLVGQQMPVDRAMRIVTYLAPLDADSTVLEHERALFIRVAFEAHLLLLESVELSPG